MSKKELLSFFRIKSNADCLFSLPSCFRYKNSKWDYVIKSDPINSAKIAEELRSSGAFNIEQLENSKLWIVKTIIH